MRGGQVAWFWSDRSSPPGRQAPTNTGQTGLRTRSGVIYRLSVDWTGVVPRPQPNGRGHLTAQSVGRQAAPLPLGRGTVGGILSGSAVIQGLGPFSVAAH